MPYLIFKRSAVGWKSFVSARKYKIKIVDSIEQARRLCGEFNTNRTPSQIRHGIKYEFTAIF